MDSRHVRRIRNRRILVQIRKITRTKMFVYFLCVLFSFSVWFTISSSQQKSKAIELNVAFVNHPENYTLINQPQNDINLHVTASGYDLQTLNKNKKETLKIDVSMIPLKQQNNQYFGVLRTENLTNEITHQLMFRGEIKQITPDSILFVYEKNIKKNLPVILNVDYQLSPQHWLCNDMVVTPKNIVIEGLPVDVDSINEIKTVYQNFDVLSDTLNIKLALEKPQTKYPVSFSADTVQLMIPVEQFTEKSFTIPIQTNLSNMEYKLKIFPDHVTVSCLVSLKNFHQLADTMFRAEVVYDEKMYENMTMLPVQIIKKPDFIKISSITPSKVEYILMK